jgi:hypothetical protein
MVDELARRRRRALLDAAIAETASAVEALGSQEPHSEITGSSVVWTSGPVVSLDEFTPVARATIEQEVQATRERAAAEMEIVAELNALTDAERGRFRRLTVDPHSRLLLRRRATAGAAPPRRARNSSRTRRRSVRTSPRRARAPASLAGDSEADPPLAVPRRGRS